MREVERVDRQQAEPGRERREQEQAGEVVGGRARHAHAVVVVQAVDVRARTTQPARPTIIRRVDRRGRAAAGGARRTSCDDRERQDAAPTTSATTSARRSIVAARRRRRDAGGRRRRWPSSRACASRARSLEVERVGGLVPGVVGTTWLLTPLVATRSARAPSLVPLRPNATLPAMTSVESRSDHEDTVGREQRHIPERVRRAWSIGRSPGTAGHESRRSLARSGGVARARALGRIARSERHDASLPPSAPGSPA